MRKKLFLIIFCLFLFIPSAKADYGIKDFYFNLNVEKNGDVVVEEYFQVNGSYNGYERVIYYANDNADDFNSDQSMYAPSKLNNGSDIEILSIKAVPQDVEFDFNNTNGTEFKRVVSANKGDYGVYTTGYKIHGISILIYNPSYKNNSFYLKYRIKNMAIRHNDVAELGWNFPINELEDSIENVKAWIHFPGNTNLRVWGHGPLTGDVNKLDNETLYAYLGNVPSSTGADLRATFDLNVIPDSNKKSNVDALNQILAYEEDMATRANNEREKNQEIYIEKLDSFISMLKDRNKKSYEINKKRYDVAYGFLNFIIDEDLRESYRFTLDKIKVELDVEEYDYGLSLIENVKKKKNYESYLKAKEFIYGLDNENNRNKLIPLFIDVIDIIKQAEIKREITFYSISVILFLLIIYLIRKSYLLFCKNPNPTFTNQYFRDIPSDLTPEVVSYLFHKKIINNALSATILSLVDRKIIEIEKTDKKDNYRIYDRSIDKQDLINPAEKRLMKVIFHGLASVETENMNDYASRNYSSFISEWNNYNKLSLEMAKKEHFYEDDGAPSEYVVDKKYSCITIIFIFLFFVPMLWPILILILAIIGLVTVIKNSFSSIIEKRFRARAILSYLFIVGLSIYMIGYISNINFFYNYSRFTYIFLIIMVIFGLFFFHNKNKLTQNGTDEKAKWQALNNFLNDFGSFKEKESIEIHMWNKYLVYATLFGCADKVLKQMKLNNQGISEEYYNSLYTTYYINNRVSSCIHSSHKSANVARSIAQASSSSGHSSSGGGHRSSGSGGGGGFSSGGGHSGGGGGGHRF